MNPSLPSLLLTGSSILFPPPLLSLFLPFGIKHLPLPLSLPLSLPPSLSLSLSLLFSS